MLVIAASGLLVFAVAWALRPLARLRAEVQARTAQDMTPILPQPDMRLVLSANGLSILALGILPQPLMALCIASIQYSL